MKRLNEIDFQRFNAKTIKVKQQPVLIEDVELTEDTSDNMKILELCRRYWESLRDFRERRKRNRQYYRGDQWSDKVRDPKTGKWITEEEYIRNSGKVPLKQNQIRQNVKNLLGQYRSNPTRPVVHARKKDDAKIGEMLSNALDYVHQINQTDELDARQFEEFGLSGAPMQKLTYRFLKERQMNDIFIANRSPQRMFFNTDIKDIRQTDLRLIGEVIDKPLQEIISIFAKTRADEARIRKMYEGHLNRDGEGMDTQGLSSRDLDYLDFYAPRDTSKCRFFEVWTLRQEWRTYVHDPVDGSFQVVNRTLSQIDQLNRTRLEAGVAAGLAPEDVLLLDAKEVPYQYWYGQYLTPDGYTLWEGESPYEHKEHPYVLGLYPLLDGEVWGFVEDIIDQQRYINRLIILMDFVISASAKGVLMIPQDSIPKGMSPEDFADEWTKVNGVIVYSPSTKHGQIPTQVSANSSNVGIKDLLAVQMQMMQEVSGVHGAIQGAESKSGTPSSLYAQQSQNASINNLDQMAFFNSFKERRDTKVLKMISQFYTEQRYLNVAGKSYDEEAKNYDPAKAKGVDCDVKITEGQDTPVFRQLIDDTLMSLLNTQQIDIEMFLEHTSMPFAEQLLESIRIRKEQIQDGEAGMPMEAGAELAQLQEQADPAAMDKIQMALGMNQ
jgi:hypothetical protein